MSAGTSGLRSRVVLLEIIQNRLPGYLGPRPEVPHELQKTLKPFPELYRSAAVIDCGGVAINSEDTAGNVPDVRNQSRSWINCTSKEIELVQLQLQQGSKAGPLVPTKSVRENRKPSNASFITNM